MSALLNLTINLDLAFIIAHGHSNPLEDIAKTQTLASTDGLSPREWEEWIAKAPWTGQMEEDP